MKFKVGDKVIMNYKYNDNWEGNGKITKIIEVFPEYPYRMYRVDFQEENDKLRNYIPGYLMDEDELKMVNSHIIRERLGIK